MERWTEDDRPLVWTVTEGTENLYSLYVNSYLVKSHMTYEEFWPLYQYHTNNVFKNAA